MSAAQPQHWAAQSERGTPFFLRLTAWLVCHCPAWLLRLCVRVVVAYFYLTAPAQRRHIARYQARLSAVFPHLRLPERPVWRQFVTFGEAITDRFAVWQRQIRYADLRVEDPDNVYAAVRRSAAGGGHGHVLVCSHVGNMEVCRALVDHHQGFVLNVLVHSRHAEAFNRALKEAGANDIRLIQVSDLDAALMLDLHRRLQAGEWIAIAADRVPVRGEKTVAVDFLGQRALMPQGPWLLACLLKAPLVSVFCSKINGQYRLRLEHFSAVPDGRKQARAATVAALAQSFAHRLAAECAVVPLQWFNFYDFWGDEADGQNHLLPPQH